MLSSAPEAQAARALAYTRVRAMLVDRSAILLPDEHRLLLDAADALLFDEPDAAAKRTAAYEMLWALVEVDRWLSGPAAEVRQELDACGGALPSLG
jgi:hypothetical protein